MTLEFSPRPLSRPLPFPDPLTARGLRARLRPGQRRRGQRGMTTTSPTQLLPSAAGPGLDALQGRL